VFIVIDGLDGSGKSTQAELLCDHFESLGKSYVMRTHPSNDNYLGRKGRAYLLKEGSYARIMASAFYMLDVIRSVALHRWSGKDYVVFVRYLMGTAYLPSPLHRVAYFFFKLLMPSGDHMFFIDVTPEEAHKRIEENRTEKEMFESLERLQKVRGRVIELSQRKEWTIIEGNQSLETVQSEIRLQVGV
jgi:dTMP kinase